MGAETDDGCIVSDDKVSPVLQAKQEELKRAQLQVRPPLPFSLPQLRQFEN
jgi:hypothetical protein